MQILFDAGVVGYNKILNETYYSINPTAINSASEYLTGPISIDSELDLNEVHYKSRHLRSQYS